MKLLVEVLRQHTEKWLFNRDDLHFTIQGGHTFIIDNRSKKSNYIEGSSRFTPLELNIRMF